MSKDPDFSKLLLQGWFNNIDKQDTKSLTLLNSLLSVYDQLKQSIKEYENKITEFNNSTTIASLNKTMITNKDDDKKSKCFVCNEYYCKTLLTRPSCTSGPLCKGCSVLVCDTCNVPSEPNEFSQSICRICISSL